LKLTNSLGNINARELIDVVKFLHYYFPYLDDGKIVNAHCA